MQGETKRWASARPVSGDRNPCRSPAAVMDGVFSRIAKEFQNYQAGPDELIDGGDVVVAVGRSKGVMASTGKPFDAQYMHVVRVADGKIVSFHQLIDTLEVWRSQQSDEMQITGGSVGL
jgi:uncharacterized protein